MIQIKSTLTLLFVVLLTGWVHFTSSQPLILPRDPYVQFLYRLERAINASGSDVLPFSLKTHVMQNLMWVSDDFKKLCLHYFNEEFRDNANAAVMALLKTVNYTFLNYIHKANTNFLVLESIKSVDPIGFIVYITMNNITISNPWFMRYVDGFQETMKQRLRLLNMKTDDSCFEIIGEDSYGISRYFRPHSINISSIARNEFATEYGPISDDSINSFTDLISEKLCSTMYHIGANVDDYREHSSVEFNDVQILQDDSVEPVDNQTTRHPICVYYKKSNMMVYIYGRLRAVKLTPKQKIIIHKLYPFRSGFAFDAPTTFPDKPLYSELFAITYASMLLLGKDPAKLSIKMNKVCGDETLYMRINILNMLANQRLALID